MALPDFLGEDSGIIPIELLTSRELLLEIFPEKSAEMAPRVKERKEESVSQEALIDESFLRRKMAELSLGESLKVPAPDVLLPPAQEALSEEERIQRFLASPFYEGIAKAFQESVRPWGSYRGTPISIDASPGTVKEQKVEVDPATELVITRLKSAEREKPIERGQEGNLGIKGPIAQRELTYVPTVPRVKATIETEFEMKFWVRPNGTVDRVIPLKRAGDVELERVAANYLRQWRFEAIPENELQAKEWGTVIIKFRLE